MEAAAVTVTVAAGDEAEAGSTIATLTPLVTHSGLTAAAEKVMSAHWELSVVGLSF